jgi:opacity protein-like surface antigen
MERRPRASHQIRPFITTVIILLTLLAASRRASAQDSASPQDQSAPTTTPAPAPRVVVDLDTGTSFGNTQAHFTYMGGVGIGIGSHVEIEAEIGRFDNIVTHATHNWIRDTAATLSAADGTLVQGSANVPAEYGLGDIRFSGECSPRIGLFLDGGVGVGHERPELTATGAADGSAQILQAVPIGSPRTALFVGGGGGLTIRLSRRATIDAGYRFARLGSTSPSYTNTIYGGWTLGWR